MNQPLQNLEQLLDRIRALTHTHERVSVAMVVESIGSRSFGPLLMLIGITLFSPLSGVPGMSFFMATFVVLLAIQLLIGRQHFWLPSYILERSAGSARLRKALNWLSKPARGIDRLLKPRLTFLVNSGGSYGVAMLCLMIGLCMPFMELVPFSSSTAGLVLLALGLALVLQDGLLVLLALVVSGAMSAWLVSQLL